MNILGALILDSNSDNEYFIVISCVLFLLVK